MSLFSVGQTALSGMAAAVTTLDLVGNNLANANTDGFKQSFPIFGSQTPQTYSLGTSPSSSSGGTSPRQVGQGVITMSIETDYSQGSLHITSDPMDVALDGPGFFVLHSSDGGEVYSRDGNFGLNQAGELINSSGDRVQGYGVGENGEINTSVSGDLKISFSRPEKAADGSAAYLHDFSIDEDGVIRGQYSDGVTRNLGQVKIARFVNPQGLTARQGTRYSSGGNSGLPEYSTPGVNGGGVLRGGAKENSNVDIPENLIAMQRAELQYKANSQVLRASNNLLDELTQIRR